MHLTGVVEVMPHTHTHNHDTRHMRDAMMARTGAVLAGLLGAASAYNQPNIVFFLADDIGWSDFGYFGMDLYGATPMIDTLAEQGVRLACVYGQTACTPGRAAFLTGRYPIRSGLQKGAIKATQIKGILTDMTLVSDELKKAGYNTAMVGKWHVGCAAWEQTPLWRGFDSFGGFLCNGQMDFYYKKNDGYYDLWDDDQMDTNSDHLDTSVRVSEVYDAKAMDFIAAQSSSTPWFLYYALQDPHTPLTSPDYFLEEYPCSQLTSDSSRQTYCGMMRCIDTAVEAIMSTVSQYGFLDNTLVIFSGDNGGAPKNGGYNWPLRGSKGTLHEGGVRQASFAWGAMLDSSVRGTTYDGQLHLVDFFPTIMAVATSGKWPGLESETLDGVNVWSAISTGAESPRTETLINVVDSAGAIRVGNYKLMVGQGTDSWYQHPDVTYSNDFSSSYIATIFKQPMASKMNTNFSSAKDNDNKNGNGGSSYQLYDVVNDPYEYTNLADTYTDIVTELAAKLEVYAAEAMDYNYQSDQYNDASSNAASTGYWGPWAGEYLSSSEVIKNSKTNKNAVEQKKRE
eukprot:m.63962 g.63962  ORF g.63962 m.63962 type:complete len:567 (+) comp8190_c0_seq1:1650-3350(+)